jgi:hypothetical protein
LGFFFAVTFTKFRFACYQHQRRVQQPRQLQCLRHRQYALLTGEAFSAARLMLFPLAGAAINDVGATVSPIPTAIRITKLIFFIISFLHFAGVRTLKR